MFCFLSSRRSLVGALLFAALAAVPAGAQATDDPDIDVNPFFWGGQGHVRCLKLAASREEVVAAFVLQDAGGRNNDLLMVAVSRDRGRSWRPHYRERIGGVYLKDIAVAVADGYSGHPQDRWIYILQETARPNVWNPATWSRVFRLVEGPLDRPWGNGLPYVHVIGGTNDADLTLLGEPLHPSIAVAPFSSHRQYVVVVTHRWVDDGDSRVVFHTPLTGSRGSGYGTSWQVVAGPGGIHGGGTYAHPSVAADPLGRWIALGFEDLAAGTVLATLADVETLRMGTAAFQPEFETDRSRGRRAAPHLGVHDNVVVMTALGEANPSVTGASELHWYSKRRAAAFQYQAMLHHAALSSAPVDYGNGVVYAAANVAVDPNKGFNPGRTAAFHGLASNPLAMTLVGDRMTLSGTPTVAALQEGSDRGIYGYVERDVWNVPVVQGLWVDPGR